MLVPEDKISVIYNGIYLSRYHRDVAPLYRSAPDEIVLGSAGRLSEEKGHLYLLELMKELGGRDQRFTLLVAGEGRLFHWLQKKARKLGVDKQTRFLGFVEDMPAFFRSLDIFLLSSHYEGFGYVIAEAMASRKPVVAFDIKSSSEIIDHGSTGYITGQGNVREMARRVLELAGDSSLRERMGRNGRNRVEEMFSFEKNREAIRKLIIRQDGVSNISSGDATTATVQAVP
jgi:glycosyltransferase involved in cell wall biosynthesis